MEVRTRFAPSPTGYMHIGNLRTALYTYLIARKNHGKFILRIEDTDQGRYVEGATDVIYRTLRTCGLNWDEGPDIGGPCGPYIQSQRMGMFKEYAEKLVESGHAYYCFCNKSENLLPLTAAPAATSTPPRRKSAMTRANPALSARRYPTRELLHSTMRSTATSR